VSDKQLALDTLQHLSEEASLPEIIEELQTLAALRLGQADIARGRFQSHEEVRRRVASWNIQ
jgi:predicted transcriptional regulator